MPVAQSAHLNEFNYDPETGTLTISFVAGRTYLWSGVSQSDYDGLARAGSKGSYLHSVIEAKYGKGKRVA